MLPYRFALIVSPFSNKHLKIPLGNYWGSPWELFPAGLIGGTPGARHLPWIDPRCTGHLDSHSQKMLQRNKLTRGMWTALWPQRKAAMGDRVFQLDCEKWSVCDFVRGEVWEQSTCLKLAGHHRASSFTVSVTHNAVNPFSLPDWPLHHLDGELTLAPGKDRRVYLWHLLLSFY